MHRTWEKPMSLVHTRSFRVRYYECDAFGHVNNANYLRYMQEAAFDAAAAAGYSVERHVAMAHVWHARETQIEYLQPLRYGDTVEVKTWVVDFRRIRSRRAYELRKAGADELVARAMTDWVYIDRAMSRPAAIPHALVHAFFPEGVPAEATPREPFRSSPPPPSPVKVRRRVTWQDIDPEGHVNNAVYLTYVEDCGFQAVAAHGWPVKRMIEGGHAILTRRHEIEYLQPAVLDDELEIATWLSEVRRASALRHYTVTRLEDGALLAQINTLGVWVNLETGLPERFPPGMLADFGPLITQQAPSPKPD